MNRCAAVSGQLIIHTGFANSWVVATPSLKTTNVKLQTSKPSMSTVMSTITSSVSAKESWDNAMRQQYRFPVVVSVHPAYLIISWEYISVLNYMSNSSFVFHSRMFYCVFSRLEKWCYMHIYSSVYVCMY